MWRNTKRLMAAGAGAALLTLAAPAAQAKTVDAWTEAFEDAFAFTCDFGTESTDDDIDLDFHVTGEFNVVLRERVPGGPLYATVRGHRTEEVTNTGTGISWVAKARFQEKDLRVLSIDEGSTTYLVGLTVHGTVFTPEGDVYSRANARAEFVLDVDNATGEGTFVETLKEVGQTGNSACEDALALTVE